MSYTPIYDVRKVTIPVYTHHPGEITVLVELTVRVDGEGNWLSPGQTDILESLYAVISEFFRTRTGED